MNPQISLILTSSFITLNELRRLLQSGVGQILIRPFTVQQILTKMYLAEQFTRILQQESEEIPPDSKYEASIDHVTKQVYMATIHGWLLDNCSLPTFEPELDSTLFVDCNSMMGLNSIGIRLWLLWLKDLLDNGVSRLELEGVRPQILKQASLVKGFIPVKGSINSFYLNYFCEELNIGRQFKFRKDYDYTSTKMVIPESIEYSKVGKKHLFILEDNYKKLLSFYKGEIDVLEIVQKQS